MAKSPVFWIITFLFILFLAVSALFFSGVSASSIFGLPSWLLYFFGVEVLFCVAYYFFTRFFWTTEED